MSEYIVDVTGLESGDYAIAREEIVRCRDCKHRHEGMCTLSDGMGDFKRWFVDDNDYCSDGEKAVGI